MSLYFCQDYRIYISVVTILPLSNFKTFDNLCHYTFETVVSVRKAYFDVQICQNCSESLFLGLTEPEICQF